MADLNGMMLFENRFWLQILGDHSRFILYGLAPEEKIEIEKANKFMNLFDRLLNIARQDISGDKLMLLTRQAYKSAVDIRTFKLYLLSRQLTGSIKMHLTPTFFNHMLNELEEYMSVLCALIGKEAPVFHPIHHHLLWLSDAVGHSAAVAAQLDEAEKELIEKSMKFRELFEGLYLKAQEINSYMRTGIYKFPALSCFNFQAESVMIPFKDFLEELLKLKIDKRLLGTLMPIMADHMAREECYYLTKLSQVSDVKDPQCDPLRARVE